jgi:hypothetical protein
MVVRRARWGDIPDVVRLSQHNRLLLEQLAPRFWRRSPGEARWTRRYFRFLLVTRRAAILVAEEQGELVGLLIGRRVPAPPVYDPGGPALLIDDFCVAAPELWATVGAALLEAATRGSTFTQIIVIAPVGDVAKSQWLESAGRAPVSSWWTKPL